MWLRLSRMPVQALHRAAAKVALGRKGGSPTSMSNKIALAADIARDELRARRRSMSREAPKQAGDIDTFSLSAPPPFDVRAPELLHEVIGTMPEKLRCKVGEFDSDATSKEACLLVTHFFWYLFVSLQLPHLDSERHELLRLAAVQYARLTVKLSCSHDTFFDYFPPLVAHVELVALRRHGALGSASMSAGQQGPAAVAVFRHVTALLGGAPMTADRFTQHMRFAERPWTDPVAAKRGASPTVPWNLGPEGPPKAPPLGPPVIPPLPTIERPAPKAVAAPDGSSGNLLGLLPTLGKQPSMGRQSSSSGGLRRQSSSRQSGGQGATTPGRSPPRSREPRAPTGDRSGHAARTNARLSAMMAMLVARPP